MGLVPGPELGQGRAQEMVLAMAVEPARVQEKEREAEVSQEMARGPGVEKEMALVTGMAAVQGMEMAKATEMERVTEMGVEAEAEAEAVEVALAVLTAIRALIPRRHRNWNKLRPG